MRTKKNVLIFPAGSEGAINIYNALKYNLHFELFGATMVPNHSEFIYDKDHYFEGNLKISDKNFFDTLNDVIDKFKIDYILCNHDEVAPFLKKNQDKINATVCLSPYETAKIAEDKKLTAQAFKDKEYMPKVYKKNEVDKYPVFIKPRISAGGKGAKIINNKKELDQAFAQRKDLMIYEYLPGEEYTIDCFTDRKGRLLFSRARTRGRVTNGITYRTNKVEDNTPFETIAKDINNTLKFRGAWFFQLKKDANGKLKLLEICVRQAGTMVFFREFGFNFPALTLFDFMEQDISPLVNDFDLTLDRCIHNSFKLKYYYKNVYIDFDDTIIVNDKVNTTAIRFIYQCLNESKKIYLISRHKNNIDESLQKYHIDKNIFTDIYAINGTSGKSVFIKEKESILIDNYYKERKEVKEALGIPVFDVDAIECLINDAEL